ncbi:hypothetical protein SJ05684_b60190 (plasmid) [Sinorhizobium sojae CCBAU 05684]|uniref:Mobile element protein n=1 Tax=Sinorhizobium sojae CCBAU 05684 TaxID=716928 RepID=A0A249PM66_9HYPH|nr:hypothetical protein SJ05684_b60190 [Sinorhizobium sojae CCBAU 05684]
MQQRLTLPRAAVPVARLAMAAKLGQVAPHGFPSSDLSFVFAGQPPAQEVAAVPLKPAARIVGMEPALGTPQAEPLAGFDSEEIEPSVPSWRQPRGREPLLRELVLAIRHVLTAENAERQHFCGCEVRREVRVKVLPYRRSQRVSVALLHAVVHFHPCARHDHSPLVMPSPGSGRPNRSPTACLLQSTSI